MPPKPKDVKKGAPVGNYKAGKLLKDIMPPGTKPPREGQAVKQEGEPDIQRSYAYLPYPRLPEWNSNEEAKNHDFTTGCEKNEDGTFKKFEDKTHIYFPPSFKDFEKGQYLWLRPEEYLREIAFDTEMQKRRAEKKYQIKKKKTMRKQSILAMGEAPSIEDLQSQLTIGGKIINDDKVAPINKEDLQFEIQCIQFDTRMETEEEVKKRKEEAEKIAALDKNAKKKPPAKGAPVADPMDEPQPVKVAVENTMDMGFLMPLYCKWATSQFQFIKDRSIRDVDTRDNIWQRIYPQENGLPVISPTGKYWVKIKFQGKERLVEIDDRMPCDAKKKPVFPRTVNNFEIWPQLLMKAYFKVYSYKWYQQNALYDNEVGDGSLVYALSGLIPEPISFKDFDQEGMDLLRRLLSDDYYFNKKAYVTCYCENDHRPKLPSQTTTLKRIDFGGDRPGGASIDGESELSSPNTIQSSAGKMLGRLRDAASLAISVTTGKKLNLNKNRDSTNIIPGFGYALMDIFENQYVDMDSIVKKKDEIEEVKSPFLSPSRRRREKGMSKEEWKKKRREEKKKEQEERERREREPPKQFSLIKIKTSVGKYPVMNYLSQFTNDEIWEAKKCLLNHIRRPPETEKPYPDSPTSIRKGHDGLGSGPAFQLNIQQMDQSPTKGTNPNITEQQEDKKEEDKLNLIEPKTRAPGGVWIASSDFPHSFQHFIVYHNFNKFTYHEQYNDKWNDHAQPYISNEKDIMIKLELDEEAAKQQKFLQVNNILHLDASARSGNQQPDKSIQSLQFNESKFESPSQLKQDDINLLPGEVIHPIQSHDNILIAYAPYPTKEPSEILPRYLMRITQQEPKVDGSVEESTDKVSRPLDFTIRSYFEGKFVFFKGMMADQNVIYLKPNIYAPQGFQLWVASSVRKISFVSRNEYMLASKQYFQKNYTVDYQPMEKGKYQVLAKYDFNVQEETKLFLKIDIPNDKYLLKFMRLKIIDKSDMNQILKQQTLNLMKLENFAVVPNGGKGYILLIEGVMPYNTTEGQMTLDVISNAENFSLDEIQSVEPLEYQDKYYPSKYGIIFKEKLYFGQEHTSASINIRLKKNGVEFDKTEDMKKTFRLEILDRDKIIYKKEGLNQITLSHFMFRSNQGLPESSENPKDEVKHAYVLQAVFDLVEWPECKTENQATSDISWCVKIFSSETIGIVKDTDKEDKEKALKASWETNEPGRAEKAKRSRQKFLLQQRLKKGEELTEEEMAIVKEVRERVRKADQQEVPVKGKAPAKAPPKGKEDPKAKGKPVQQVEEVDESKKKPLPEAKNHVNAEIKEYLNHFQSERLIYITCDKDHARKRTDQEKESLLEQRNKEREKALQDQENLNSQREAQKEERVKFKQKVFSDIESSRSTFKENFTTILGDRNKYRDLISNRKDKDKALQDLLASDKVDLATLQKLIDEAKEALVREEVIAKGERTLDWLKYCKEIETLLQQAVAEKNKENLVAVLERIEKEGISMDPKMLTDAKNNLAKMK